MIGIKKKSPITIVHKIESYIFSASNIKNP
jgi:hypothetical protein